MGGTRDNPPVCSCCVPVYQWGQEARAARSVLDVWLADGWSLTPPALIIPPPGQVNFIDESGEFLPRP